METYDSESLSLPSVGIAMSVRRATRRGGFFVLLPGPCIMKFLRDGVAAVRIESLASIVVMRLMDDPEPF